MAVGNYCFCTIKSMYTFLCFGDFKTNLSKSVWTIKIPLNYRLFL
jgi:hypothetical protein